MIYVVPQKVGKVTNQSKEAMVGGTNGPIRINNPPAVDEMLGSMNRH